MSRKCQVTGKKIMFGNNVSHAKNRTRRTFLPNIQDTTLYSEILGKSISIRVTPAGLRTLDHKGGIDAYLQDTPASKLDAALVPLKKQVEKLLAAKSA